MTGFDWGRLGSDPLRLREAAEVVQSHLTRAKTPTYGPVSDKLVEYGIARLRVDDVHQGQIVEPLAFLSLMKWLEGRPDDFKDSSNSLRANIRSRLASPFSRGYAYEEVLILFLHRTMRDPWVNDEDQIAGRLDGLPVPVDILGEAPENPGLSVVQYADSMNDILDWIENGTAAPAVLVPNSLFGPDITMWCRTQDGGSVILMVQAKSYLTGGETTLYAANVKEAVESLCEVKWFSTITDPSKFELRRKLIEAIGRHRVLRFVAGYPLFADLNVKTKSVRAAIATLGTDAALATVELDPFRSCFIAEGARNLLEPMDAARSKKRKADEMGG